MTQRVLPARVDAAKRALTSRANASDIAAVRLEPVPILARREPLKSNAQGQQKLTPVGRRRERLTGGGHETGFGTRAQNHSESKDS